MRPPSLIDDQRSSLTTAEAAVANRRPGSSVRRHARASVFSVPAPRKSSYLSARRCALLIYLAAEICGGGGGDGGGGEMFAERAARYSGNSAPNIAHGRKVNINNSLFKVVRKVRRYALDSSLDSSMTL